MRLLHSVVSACTRFHPTGWYGTSAEIRQNNYKICTKYLNQVKSFFPVITKNEKKFLSNYPIFDACPEDQSITLEYLHEEFGKPEEIFSAYLSTVHTDELVRQIKRTKRFKIATVLILLITAATLIGACINIHNNYNAYQETVDDINGYWIDEIH